MPRTRSVTGEPADKTTTKKVTEASAKSGGKSKASKSSGKAAAEPAKPAQAGEPEGAAGSTGPAEEKRAKSKSGAASAEPKPLTGGAPIEPPAAAKQVSQSPPDPKPEIATPDSKPQAKPLEPAPSEQQATAPPAADEPPPDDIGGIALPASHGKATIFGGPKDHSAKPDDKLGLPTGLHFQYERVRSLNPKSFYCAMRWDYRQQHMSTEEGKRWWANKKVLVTNPATGAAVVLRAVDHGPHESTGFMIGISPGAAEALGIEVGQEVDIKFADQKTPVGKVLEQG
jgi:hypothetical protein